jgi:hypothetical protein
MSGRQQRVMVQPIVRDSFIRYLFLHSPQTECNIQKPSAGKYYIIRSFLGMPYHEFRKQRL